MLLRRHRKKKEEVKIAEIVQEVREVPMEDNKEELEEPTSTDLLTGLTVNQLKKILDREAIEYNQKAKKEELIKLLEGAE